MCKNLSGEMLPRDKKPLNNVLGWENENHKIVHPPLDNSEFNKILNKNEALLWVFIQPILMLVWNSQ
jgi:hypothetical protein